MTKRKPDHLKVLEGTARKDRLNPDAPAFNAGVADCPDWLSERASEIFAHFNVILLRMGVASPDDQMALAMLASRVEEIEICTATIEDVGRTYTTTATSGDKLVRGRPEVSMRSEAMRHVQSLLNEFGLTPAARGKVSASIPVKENPFAAIDRAG
jgi:P27 family predicted phage terminase small subunit